MNKCYALVWNVSQGCWNVVSEGCRRRGKPAGAKAAIASALALLGATALAPAYALPSGGTVVGGSANGEIHLSGGNSLSVNQKVDKLIANWDSFSVAAGERVIFNQPSSSSIALNRVIGTKASDIQGRIDANGQVFLVNPNGVLFGRGAQVNVGGLVASTLDITDAEFNGNSSRYRFTGPSTNGVLNQGGAITAAEGGSIALLGAQVDNRGTVLAQMGGVGLGAGSDLTLNFDGNKLLDIRVDAGVANALASNGGLLKADGGASPDGGQDRQCAALHGGEHPGCHRGPLAARQERADRARWRLGRQGHGGRRLVRQCAERSGTRRHGRGPGAGGGSGPGHPGEHARQQWPQRYLEDCCRQDRRAPVGGVGWRHRSCRHPVAEPGEHQYRTGFDQGRPGPRRLGELGIGQPAGAGLRGRPDAEWQAECQWRQGWAGAEGRRRYRYQ